MLRTRPLPFTLLLLLVTLAALGPAPAEARKKKAPEPAPAAGKAGPDAKTASPPAPWAQSRARADVAYREGDYDTARRQYEQALREGAPEDDPVLHYNAAVCSTMLSIPDRARTHFAKARDLVVARLQASPEKPSIEDVYYLAAIANYPAAAATGGTGAEWREWASKAAERYRSGGYGKALAGADYFRLSKILEFLRDPGAAGAMDSAVQAYRKTPSPGDPYYAVTLSTRGAELVRAGTLPEGEDLLARAVAANPYVAGGWYNLGMAQVGLGRLADAEKSFAAGSIRDRRNMTECNYCLRLVRTINRFRVASPGSEVPDLSAVARPDLEARILGAAGEASQLRMAIAGTEQAGGIPTEGDRQAYREAQFQVALGLLEYARRGLPVNEFALQNSLIGIVFDR